MVKKIITKIVKRNHFWRTIDFDELAELYTSQFLRSLALSLVGIFVPIYLYKLGFSLQDIFLMQVVWSAFYPISATITAKIIASMGPKHAMAFGTIFQIIYLILLISIDGINWPLWFFGVLGSISYSLFIVGIEVEFSKIKHTEHGGKELSILMICERVGASIGPLLGGLIASFIDPRLTIFVATIIMLLSLIPLFLSQEPTKARQKLIIKGFPWRRHKRDFLIAPFVGIENIVSVLVWPLFISISVFQTNTYYSIGLLTSVSTAVALIVIYLIGRLIDGSKGLVLLKLGTIANATLHFIRPVIATPLGAFIVSLINEPLTASYRMPLSKGLYDAADSVPGYRIIYLTIFDLFRMLGLFIFWLTAYIATFFITNDTNILKFMFIIGGVSSLGILFQKFPALKS